MKNKHISDEQFEKLIKQEFDKTNKNYDGLSELFKNMKKETQLSEDEVTSLQKRIVSEHWFPTKEAFSLHIYESRYVIDDIEYVFYKAIGKEYLEVYKIEK